MTVTDEQPSSKTRLDAIIETIVGATARAKRDLEPEMQVHKWAATTDYLENLEAEVAPTMRIVLGRLLEQDSLPEPIRELVRQMVAPEHQFNVLLQFLGLIGTVISAIPELGKAELLQVVNALNGTYTDAGLAAGDAASAYVRGLYTLEEAQRDASWQQINTNRFGILATLAQAPPSPPSVYAQWRQGQITTADFEALLQISGVPEQYWPLIEDAAFSYMGTGDILNLAIKQLIEPATAKAMFGIAGGRVDQFDLLLSGVGTSVAPSLAIEYWNQGYLTEGDVNTTLAWSGIAEQFWPWAKLQRHKFLGPIQIEAALKAHVVSSADATTWMEKLGYPPDQVAAFVGAEGGTAVAKPKTETEALVVEQYTDQLLSRDEAEAGLADLGYDATQADMILSVADYKKASSQRTAALTAVRSAFLAGHINVTEASAALDKLGEPAAARDQWISDWEVELATRTKTFSEAQVGSFLKKGLISTDDAVARWLLMGYSDADTLILVEFYGGSVPKPTPTTTAT